MPGIQEELAGAIGHASTVNAIRKKLKELAVAGIGFRTWSGRIAADRLNALPAALLETMSVGASPALLASSS